MTDLSKNDGILIAAIVARANANLLMAGKETMDAEAIAAMSADLAMVQTGDVPLDLAQLVNAEEFIFNFDVFGIRKNLDRETGKFKNFFHPRCAASSEPPPMAY